MRYQTLGDSDLVVPAVAMGCWALAGDGTWGPQDVADSVATVHAALEVGVTFFDTAEGYGAGDSETMLGRALAGRRHEAIVATKVSRANLAPDGIQQACEDSLRRLQTDYIDLYQVHWPSRSVPVEETVGALEALRQQGKVRAVGVCNFGLGDLARMPAGILVRSNQLPYSLLWRAIEHDIQGRCVEAGIGILCYSPLAQGLLTDKFASLDDVPDGRARSRLFSGQRSQARHGQAGCEPQVVAALARIRRACAAIGEPMARVALAWLLHRPGVASVLAGARRPDQIRETAVAADLALSPDVVAELAAATEDVKTCAGPNPDMWQAESRFR